LIFIFIFLGRLDVSIYVGPPDENSRTEILKISTKDIPLDQTVNLEYLSRLTINYTGADLKNLVRNASLLALQRELKSGVHVLFIYLLFSTLTISFLKLNNIYH